MPRSKNKMPTKHQIAAAWLAEDNSCNFIPREWGSTVSECLCCWRCGHRQGVERAHLRADCFGGSVDADNLVLLCSSCHEYQPDGLDRQTQIDWIARGESRQEIDARCGLLFAMAGTTVEMFVKRFGERSLTLFNELAEKSIALSAGPSNAHGNLAALIHKEMRKETTCQTQPPPP